MGFVESKLRHLIHKLEDYRTPNVLYAVPHPDKFVDASSGHPLNANYFLGIVLDFSKSDTSKRAVDFTPAVKDFIATITQFLSYTPEMGVDVNYVKKFVSFQFLILLSKHKLISSKEITCPVTFFRVVKRE